MTKWAIAIGILVVRLLHIGYDCTTNKNCIRNSRCENNAKFPSTVIKLNS